MADQQDETANHRGQPHVLVPPGMPIPRGREQWLINADWWEDHGEEGKSKTCRSIANSLPPPPRE